MDLGDRRIGFAVSDPTGTIATPAGHITRRAGKRLPVAPILARAGELGVEGFVIGLALDGAGEETARSHEARRLGSSLGERSGMPVHYVDERFTTAAALKAVREMEGSTRGRRGDVDAIAATLLLRAALDRLR
ncbi:MAG: Holliday junction resolvase RuvX [Gemmatimonadaceae bacterium]